MKQSTPEFFLTRWLQSVSKHPETVPKAELISTLEKDAAPSVSYFCLLLLAAIIATVGLLQNSAATIIGAMVIAPLMNPILAFAYALVDWNWSLLKRTTVTILASILSVVGIASLCAGLVGYHVTDTEILSRIAPNLLDLVVALAAGMAGALARVNRVIANAVPGVAISIALVPPLCVAGIGVTKFPDYIIEPGLQQSLSVGSMEGGAFLLFTTNLVAIIFCGGLTFSVMGYSSRRKIFLNSFIYGALLTSIVNLLGFYNIQQAVLRARILYITADLGQDFPHWKVGTVKDVEIFDADKLLVSYTLESTENNFSRSDLRVIRNRLREELKRPVEVQFRIIEYRILDDEIPDVREDEE
ncbi:MAG: DUF389 domain-containing protein [Cyanobacteria bacterium P01_H01_bin.15]